MNKQILFLLVVAASIAACKKSPFDYRNMYVGNYNFTNIYTSVDSSGTITNRTTTFFGRAKTDGDDKIVFEFDADKSQSLRMDKDGNVFNACESYVGRFENESRFQAALSKQNCSSVNLDENTSVAIVGNRKY